MYIKIREDRINVEQINTYLFNDTTKVLTICFLNDAVRIYHGATKLVQELDRVCNPKELKSVVEVVTKEIVKNCETCAYYQEGKQPDGILWQSCDHEFQCANIYEFHYKAKDE
jgi:hypothetical protein